MTKNYYTGKKILITGGLGFIGSNLAISLVKKGSEVLIIDALIPEYGGNIFNIQPIKNKVSINYSDIRDANALNTLVKDHDVIFNLAGTLSHVDSMTHPMTDLEINCRAQLSLLEAVRHHNPKTKIVFAGTRNQYGKAQYLPVDEHHPQEPTDINGINNIAAEKYHLMYTQVYGIKTVSLRMTNTYGPRHQMRHSRQGVLNWFIRQIIDGNKIELYGDGSQVRDVNFVDDVVEALLVVGQSEEGWGEAYNLGGVPVSLENFVKETIRIHKKGSYTVKPFPKDRKAIEIGDYVANYTKMKNTFGWTPKTALSKGIEKTIAYYEKNKAKYW
jgi:nucleoside-diphosphate-sugar epimerase